MHRLIGCVRKLETMVPRHRSMTPAERQRRMKELLSKLGVAEHELDPVYDALRAMSASELQVWIVSLRVEASPWDEGHGFRHYEKSGPTALDLSPLASRDQLSPLWTTCQPPYDFLNCLTLIISLKS